MDDAQPRVVESYRDYKPPFDTSKVVRNLLRTVPEKYLRGLDCVVLVNAESLPRKQRLGKVWSRKRKFARSEVLGFYHQKWQGRPSWIEIRIDKTLNAYPRFLL